MGGARPKLRWGCNISDLERVTVRKKSVEENKDNGKQIMVNSPLTTLMPRKYNNKMVFNPSLLTWQLLF